MRDALAHAAYACDIKPLTGLRIYIYDAALTAENGVIDAGYIRSLRGQVVERANEEITRLARERGLRVAV